jgi:hypothetical protein
MTVVGTIFRVALIGVMTAEAYAWADRRMQQSEQYKIARERSLALQRPLLVFGDWSPCADGRTLGQRFSVVIPEAGGGAWCEEDAPRDLAQVPDDSVVVVIDGVLEYAQDCDAILAELRRVAGIHIFLGARLQPWTLTANTLARRTGAVWDLRPVSTARRVGVAGLLATIIAGALHNT